MLSAPCLSRRCRYLLSRARSRAVNWRDRWIDPSASSFFKDLTEGGFNPNAHIDVLPQQRLIYVCVPKSASTTIKAILSILNGRRVVAAHRLHQRRYSGLKSPAHVGLSAFHSLARSPDTLRFSFVRNPYARLVSAWADKFKDRPLVPGDPFIDLYLEQSASIDRPLPTGLDRTLSFAEFADFASATAERRLDAHWHLQDDLLKMPGIALDFVGTTESFDSDFDRVLTHVGADERLRETLGAHLNPSHHRPWPDYYNDALAARVYRAYERDFDRFGYARAIRPSARR